jgi:UDP-glucose 4-epimerase
MSIICILGGLGYIGSHIALKFLQNNINVLLIDNLSNSIIDIKNNIQSIYPNVLFENCDIKNEVELGNTLIKYNISTIIYPFRDSFTSQHNYMINYMITTKLYSLFNSINYYNLNNENNETKINKLIFSSNVDIYSSDNDIHIEDDNFNIDSLFSFFICLKEKMITDYYNLNNLSIIILRLSIPVGAHTIFCDIYKNKDYITNKTNLQNNLISHFIYDDKFYIHGCNYKTVDGSITVNLLSVFDISNAFLSAYLLIDKHQRIFRTYNIANSYSYTLLQLIKILDITNINNKIEPSIRFYVSPKVSYKNINRNYNIQRAQKELNWSPYRSVVSDISILISSVIKIKKEEKTQSNLPDISFILDKLDEIYKESLVIF